ncbi:MAG: GTP-binding protein [Candidatus Lokiarchaeota archaeon]|nr:GTP-binding protein [Candidatus Lokiarchaeota archaeon]MBD3198447.1 GTP-binding protein [Candidatus Lokiarchaeota archaeon]
MTKNEDKKGFVFKITVIGDGAVGKTSLIKKYTQGSFQKDYIKTLGAQFSKYDEEIEGENCKLFFWDIAGQDEFNFMRPTFYKGSKAAIIVFSHTDEESFKHITDWHDDIKKYCGDIPIILFGNKLDLVDKENLQDEKVDKLVKERRFLDYFKTSAKTGTGVYKGFQAIINELYNKYKES